MSLFGVGSYHGAGGLNLGKLFSHLFCVRYGGLFSLYSCPNGWAKKTTGTELIDQMLLVTKLKAGWLQTVAELSQRAGINMPEVGIFPSYQF